MSNSLARHDDRRLQFLCAAGAAAALATLGVSYEARSQQAPAEEATGLQEITVTATRRSTTVQDTPVSITAVTGEELLERGVGNVSALAQETPGVSMKNNGPGQTEYEMRGLSSIGGYTATVGFYLDDVPMTAPGFSFLGKVVVDPNVYDLNRVEVLRGPQGTLFGAGSMGGTIRLITNEPNSTKIETSAETILSGTAGGGFNHTENAMLNLPLIDNQLAVRLVVTQNSTSGWIDRIVVSPFPAQINATTRGNVLAAPVQADFKGANSEDLYGGRISALFTPTDLSGLTIGATLMFQRIDQAGEQNYDSNPGTLAHYQPYNVPEPFSDSFTMGTINVNYKFDSFDITSVTSDWSRYSSMTQDASDVTSFDFFGLSSVYPADGGYGPVAFTENDQSRQFTEEVRIASIGDSHLQWLAGIFYSNFSSTQNYYSFADGFIPQFGTNDLYTQYQPQTLKQKAAFGEVSYRIIDALKFTVGGRYFEYTSTVDNSASGILSATGGPDHLLIDTSGKAHGVDPKFNLSYDVDSDLMVYATAEKGFRPGGGNQPVPSNGVLGAECLTNLKSNGLNAVPDSFNPDSLWSYELGEKYKIGSVVTLDSAVYHERWSNVQQMVTLPCGFVYVDNSGTAVVNGGELEAKAYVTSAWELAANFGYAKSYFTAANAATGTAQGQALYDIPLVTASGALTYHFDITADWKGSLRGSYDWTDKTPEPKETILSGYLPSRGFANLRATVFNHRWTVAVFVNNLTNKHTELEPANTLSAYVSEYQRLTSNQPLTAGVDANVRF